MEIETIEDDEDPNANLPGEHINATQPEPIQVNLIEQPSDDAETEVDGVVTPDIEADEFDEDSDEDSEFEPTYKPTLVGRAFMPPIGQRILNSPAASATPSKDTAPSTPTKPVSTPTPAVIASKSPRPPPASTTSAVTTPPVSVTPPPAPIEPFAATTVEPVISTITLPLPPPVPIDDNLRANSRVRMTELSKLENPHTSPIEKLLIAHSGVSFFSNAEVKV